MKPLISVIINVYNGEKYIETCVKSILAQTYSNFELLIVNDGSTDRTATIANKLGESYANILRVIHSQNIGVSSSRHLGLTEAKGEYIIFVDVDDWVNPNYLQQLYEAIEREEADMSICAYYEEYESGHQEIPLRKPLNTTDFIRDMIYGRTWGVVWNKLFKTSLLKKHGITFEKGICNWEDVSFSLSYALFCKKIAYVEQPLYHYVKYNTTSITATEGVNVQYNQDRVKAVRLLEQYLKQSDRTIEFDVDILWLKFWIKDMFITHAMSRERIALWQTSFPEVNARWKEQYSKKDILHWALVHHYAWIPMIHGYYYKTRHIIKHLLQK